MTATNEFFRKTYNACDPQRPASQEQYFDCSPARGQGPFTQRVRTCLEMEAGHARFLFAGHLGCGKSSELAALHRELCAGPVGDKSFLPVLVPSAEYLDPYDTDVIDILLAVVTEVAATLRDQYEIELKDSCLAKRFGEFKSLLSDFSIEKGEFSLLGAKAEIQRLRRDPDARQRVRAALEHKKSTVLDEINLLLLDAKEKLNKRLQKKGGAPVRDFVLILDDLEKTRCFGGKEEGFQSQRELFLERAPQLTALEAHVVYSIPLNLARGAGVPLQQAYGSAPAVLPMVKVFHRGAPRKAWEEGHTCLKHVLARRAAPHKVEELVAADALRFLIESCGGHVRQLLQFVREAIAYARARRMEPPLPLEAAERAVGQTVATYSTMVPESHWSKLVDLEVSPDQRIPNGDSDYLDMLENLSVLEYVNGGRESLEPWYAVHPLVRRLGRFDRELSARTGGGKRQRAKKRKK